MYNNSICIIYNIIYNTTQIKLHQLKHKHNTSSNTNTNHTIKHITPQPSTPIERAGSDYS